MTTTVSDFPVGTEVRYVLGDDRLTDYTGVVRERRERTSTNLVDVTWTLPDGSKLDIAYPPGLLSPVEKPEAPRFEFFDVDLTDEDDPFELIFEEAPEDDGSPTVEAVVELVESLLTEGSALGLTEAQADYVRSRFADLGIAPIEEEPEVEEEPVINYMVEVTGPQSEILELREEAERQILSAQRFGRFTSVRLVDELNLGTIEQTVPSLLR